MCTYNARPAETVRVELPLSRSPFKVPESDVMIITIIPPDRAVNLADSVNPTALLQAVSQYQTPTEQGGLGFRRDIAIEGLAHQEPCLLASLKYRSKCDYMGFNRKNAKI